MQNDTHWIIAYYRSTVKVTTVSDQIVFNFYFFLDRTKKGRLCAIVH